MIIWIPLCDVICFTTLVYLILIEFFLFILAVIIFWFFFFQAEDGIRDHCVTGVQTCALPICCSNGACSRPTDSTFAVIVYQQYDREQAPLEQPDQPHRIQTSAVQRETWQPGPDHPRISRSEERRVGKDCRCRGSTYHQRRKEE